MNERSKPGNPLLQPGLRAALLSPMERGEINRQGAKAAARGDTACTNPFEERGGNRATADHAEALWDQRREAWRDGHELQTSRPGIRRPPASLGSDPGALERQLCRLQLEINDAHDTLAQLRDAIAEASSEECLLAIYETVRENERLHEALHEQSVRAAQEADTATAALEHAVRASETDQLTQLPNRLVLWDRLEHDLALAKRRNSSLAVIYLDLDGFKDINDRLGHEGGDLLLQHVAQTLVNTVRTSDTVCRVGGDEFVIVASDIVRDELLALTAKIALAVAAPFVLRGTAICTGVSIGAASFPDEGQRADALVRAADEAMYEAKRQRRTSCSTRA